MGGAINKKGCRMLTGLFAMSILIMTLFPATPLARSLHRWLVEWPLDMASRMERRHVLVILILLFAGQSLALIGGTELAIAYAVDMSVYADALLLSYLAGAAVRLRNGWWVARPALGRLASAIARPRARARRTKPAARRPDAASNDDDPAWILPAMRAA